jgi:hypothetical protein
MVRGSRKRKASSRDNSISSSNSNNKNNNSNMWSSSGSRPKSKKKSSSSSSPSSITNYESAAETIFSEFADPEDPKVATMEGISILCDRISLDIEDIRILALLWKMNAVEKPAQISKKEFVKGCAELKLDSFDKFKELLPTLDTGFLERKEFKDFYKFCFQFNRQGTHRTLDKDLVVALLPIVLKDRIPVPRLETFCAFLEHSHYTHITLDQWSSFLDFCYECEDISSYNVDNSAWPVLIDEYVEYMEEQVEMATK